MSPTHRPPSTDNPDVLRAEISETRADLGDTVDALAAKTDLRGRAKSRLAERRQAATAAAGRVTTQIRAKAAPAAGQARGYALTAREKVSATSPRTRGSARAAAGAAVLATLILLGLRRRRRRAAAPWYRRLPGR
ncbi:DUF3618 domain-containing protein [Cryptosporangium minutisporangium]|uniref:DUF3618 domain-containing protein n=1 Tax=Cryptosporangium minutisporangium TaxID=113569 RepID=A0ABP6SSE2_9ACTN